jgi:hypothetical protein
MQKSTDRSKKQTTKPRSLTRISETTGEQFAWPSSKLETKKPVRIPVAGQTKNKNGLKIAAQNLKKLL